MIRGVIVRVVVRLYPGTNGLKYQRVVLALDRDVSFGP